MVESAQNCEIKNSKAEDVKCMGCYSILDYDHHGIKCPQAHDICSNCTVHYVKEVMDNPWANLPPICPNCRYQIPERVFERQLDPINLEIYQLNVLSLKLDKEEKIMRCPECTYFEVWLKSSTSCLLHCKKPECLKVTCAFCNLKVEIPGVDRIRQIEEEVKSVDHSKTMAGLKYRTIELNEDEFEEKLNEDKVGVYYHYKCAELYHFKKSIEKAIDRGEKRRCPQCKLAGRKDDACTHMTCSVCQTIWCYFCGLSEGELDLNGSARGIYAHNSNWNTRTGRCPMYLTQINEIDNRWPLEDKECLDRVHRYWTLMEFKKVIETIGIENYRKACEQFNSITNCGYNLEDLEDPILSEPLIKKLVL